MTCQLIRWGPIERLYQGYTAGLPTEQNVLTATFADDTAILASHENPQTASKILQTNMNKIQQWVTKWRIKPYEAKSVHVTFTTRKETGPPVHLYNYHHPQAEDAKYLGTHLDRRLTWRKHVYIKRKQLGLKLTKLYYLIRRNSKLTLDNTLLVYKIILKPIWTYGIQLWGTSSNSNLDILDRTLPVKGTSHDNRCSLVCAQWCYPEWPWYDYGKRRNKTTQC
jgi:hypothetical protein